MKRILIALMVAMTLYSFGFAQNNTTAASDSTAKVKVLATKTVKDKASANTTAVTVVGIDTTDTDSYKEDVDSAYVNHGKASFTFDSDASDFPFGGLGGAIGGGIIVSIIAIVAFFGFPIFVLFLIFFFRYKNRKARYRLAEQALAAGQPLPEGFIKENRPTDQRSQGIKNTFTGIGLFIFLWAITGEFGIGAIGLLVMFMGLGQWLISYQRENRKESAPQKNEELNKEEE